jgi:hypothetical protein
MADEGTNTTGSSILRAVLTASAGAAAVFVLDRYFFRRESGIEVAALESLDDRVARLEGAMLSLPSGESTMRERERPEVWEKISEST